MSIVSVSRRAFPPQRGHGAFTKPAASASGEPPLPLICTLRGRTTGRFSSFSGTMPHRSQYSTGIGAPQYLWRLIPQSRSRKLILASPSPRATSQSVAFRLASAIVRPSRNPELILRPSPV